MQHKSIILLVSRKSSRNSANERTNRRTDADHFIAGDNNDNSSLFTTNGRQRKEETRKQPQNNIPQINNGVGFW